MSAHRGVGLSVTAAHDATFVPAHCSGATSGGCTHPHPGEPAWLTFADLDTVDVRCDRKGIHGSHDTTEGRCPGVRDATLPAPHITRRAAQARAAIGGQR